MLIFFIKVKFIYFLFLVDKLIGIFFFLCILLRFSVLVFLSIIVIIFLVECFLIVVVSFLNDMLIFGNFIVILLFF